MDWKFLLLIHPVLAPTFILKKRQVVEWDIPYLRTSLLHYNSTSYIQPHILNDGQPHFHLENIGGSDAESFQWNMYPSGPSQLKFFSSEKITPDQSTLFWLNKHIDQIQSKPRVVEVQYEIFLYFFVSETSVFINNLLNFSLLKSVIEEIFWFSMKFLFRCIRS